jgi:SAM-dependent methyltransferase
MRFPALRRHWERLGRHDPFWAVLTDPDKRGGGWDVSEFFRSGVEEIDSALARASALGVLVARRRALDFGCGAGRLTQALAPHFARCDGVDISASMLRLAREHNRYPDRCTYHLNAAPDLALFEDESFDFVYSTLVLQHMEPRYSTHYMRELVRVLAPGGLLVFQLPSQRSTQEPPAGARRTAIAGPLPANGYRARLTTGPSSFVADPGAQITLDVVAENHSSHPWPALPDARGHHQICVANRWLFEDGDLLQRDDGRCPLPFDVNPGSSASTMLVVTAPRVDGRYLLELDLVQEDVAWFGEQGSPTLRIPCRVGSGIAASPRPRRAAAPELATTFRVRHPRAFAIMKATGIRDVYWVWRRGLDRVKSIRDQIIIKVRQLLYLPHIWNRVVSWWRRGPFEPRMEMYWVPRAEVVTLLQDCGARVVQVDDEWTPGFQSCRYWVSKAVDDARQLAVPASSHTRRDARPSPSLRLG